LAIPQTQAAGLTTWELDPAHSLVEFSVKHMMFATVKGRFSDVKGTIVTDPADYSKSSVDVTIDAATIDTRDERRDGHLKSPDFLDVANYPTITFKSTKVVSEDATHLTVIGDLTIHGVTKPVELKTQINGQGKNPYGLTVAGFSATTAINRKDFSLNWNVALETGGWLVGDEIKIAIEGELIQK
jgi:polyisoprenoid-binding protein YceI